MNKTASFTAIAVSYLFASNSAWALTDLEYENKVAEINNRYQQTYDSANTESVDIEKESKSCLIEGSFDADWEITKISFDIPEVKFNNKEMSFDTVKTTFNNKVIAKTKVPKTYFENKNIGFGIKTKVPVIRWEMEEISTKVPEFKWDRTSFSTKIPEFNSKRIEWKFHILKIKKLKELNIPCKNEEKRANDLSNKLTTVADQHKAELNKLTAALLATKADSLATDIVTVETEFDKGLASMDEAIAQMQANGVDPAGVQVDFDGTPTTVIGAKEMLSMKKLEAMSSMRASHQQMLDQITALVGS